EVGQRFAKVDEAVKALIESKATSAEVANTENIATYNWTRWLIITITLAAVLIGLAIAFFMARSIANAARQMAGVADGISRGELDHTITVKSKDEIGDIATA